MNSKVLFCLLNLALLTNSCISEFNAKLPLNDKQILFVDGNIMENSEVIFNLSKSFSMDSLTIPQESVNINAILTMIGGNGYESAPAINLGRGKYLLYVGELDDNVEYGIRIEYDGDTYQSSLSKPIFTPEIDSVSWIQPEPYGDVFFRVSTHDNSNEAKFFIWNYAEDWEFIASQETTLFYEPLINSYYFIEPAPYYYCWRSFESNTFLIGSTESLRENRVVNKPLYRCDPVDLRFSVLYSVIVSQKAISKGAYDYYLNKIQLNEEMGGLFTPQPSELNGNISCISDPSKKAMGYIEITKNATQKRIFLYPNQITRGYYKSCDAISADSVLSILNELEITYADFYGMGYRPSGMNIDSRTRLPLEWASVYCTDCIANGGTKNKPDFWPNDHE